MYQALLTRRYLLSKVMPLLAALAVTLCVAMVLIVWSVMGGFLRTLLEQGRTTIGDVSITYPVSGPYQGIAQYDELIERLRDQPEVGALTPVVESLALVNLPHGETKPVQIVGIEPDSYNAVTGYTELLYWKPIGSRQGDSVEPLPPDLAETREAHNRPTDLRQLVDDRYLRDGRSLSEFSFRVNEQVPAIVLGILVGGTNQLTEQGYFDIGDRYFMPDREVTITVAPIDSSGRVIEPVERVFPVANELHSGMAEADANRAFVPLETLQRMLLIDGKAERLDPTYEPGTLVTDPETGELRPAEPVVLGAEPARITAVLVRAADGISDETLLQVCKRVYAQFADGRADVPPFEDMERWNLIYTWQNKPELRQFIGAVKKEIGLVLVLFSFISITAVFLVFSIFWSMISEKTRDIGILRAVGAGRAGIVWLFLRYGLAIGIVGALGGLALGLAVVFNINAVHQGMIAAGRAFGQDWAIWDPKVYYFFEIPSDVNPKHAAIVTIAGVLAAALGAIIPAIRAAWMDPVRAIRFE